MTETSIGTFRACLPILLAFSLALIPPAQASADQGETPFLDSLSAAERAWLIDHPEITVVFDPGWPPIEFAGPDGKFSGMSADYFRLAENLLGIQFRVLKGLSWQDAYSMLQRGEVDMTTCVAETPRRLEFLAFTKPYLRIPIVIATKMEVTYISSMEELNGKRVALVKGYAVDDWIPKDYPEIDLVRVSSAQAGLEALRKGEVFAYIDSFLIIGDYQAKMKITQIKIAGQTPYENAVRMAVRKDLAPLASILDKALDTITETKRAEIYQSWLPVRYDYGFDYRLFWRVLGVLAAIVAGLGLWVWKLSVEIGKRKRAEIQLNRGLDEKQVLLREIHHRVKNNLNIISSLLNLQALSLRTPDDAMEAFRISRNRVMSLALVHEELYRSQDYSRVDMDKYIGTVTSSLLKALGPGGRVRAEAEANGIELNIDLAIPCGLILNELITNAVKHAFPDERKGCIRVTLKKTGDHEIELSVADDGVGIPRPEGVSGHGGLGLDLVELLVQQLRGSMMVETKNGAAYRIRFPSADSE